MDSVYFVVGSYGFIVHIYCTLTEGLFFTGNDITL